MTPKEAILKIQQLFEEQPVQEEVTKVEMSEYILADGNKVMISALEVGGSVTDAEGNPAADGNYELADGTMMQVAGGKIAELSSKEEEASPEEEMKKEEDKEMYETIVNEFKEKFNSLNAENNKLKSELDSVKGKMKEGFSQVLQLVESISKVPQSEPIQKPNSFKFQDTKDIKLERLNRYREAILNLNN